MIKKILIVEDEMIIATSLQISLQELGYEDIELLDSFEEVSQLIKQNSNIDLAFLDIDLGCNSKYDGIDVGKLLAEKNIPFIYLTSYADRETVNKALNTNPTSYLLKPLTKNSLFSQIELFKKKLSQNMLVIKDAGIIHKINCDDIYYIQAEGNYTNIVLQNRKIVLRKSLIKLELLLPNIFIKTHKAYMVNTSKIAQINNQQVLLINKEALPLSRHYKNFTMNHFNNN